MQQVIWRIPWTVFGWFPDGVPIYGFGMMPFIAFILSRTVGRPNGHDDIGAWEIVGTVSLVFEATAAVLAFRALSLLSGPRERAPMRRGPAQPIRDF